MSLNFEITASSNGTVELVVARPGGRFVAKSRCRFTRHFISNQFSTCPLKGHLLDRPATGGSARPVCFQPLARTSVASNLTE